MASFSAGIGIYFTAVTQTILTVAAASLFTFLVLFAALVRGQTNEILIARRVIMWARAAVLALVVLHGIQLSLDVEVSTPIALPDLRLARPITGIVLMFLAFFVSSHQVFRWLVVLGQPLFVAADTYTAAMWSAELTCRLAGTCLKQSGYTLSEVALLVNRQYSAMFFELWLTLAAAYLLICMGACHSRYPVRLFSITKPLSQLPPKIDSYARIEEFGAEDGNVAAGQDASPAAAVAEDAAVVDETVGGGGGGATALRAGSGGAVSPFVAGSAAGGIGFRHGRGSGGGGASLQVSDAPSQRWG